MPAINLERVVGDAVLCRVSLGMTLYLPGAPTREDIMRAYGVYRSICPAERRTLVTTARNPLFLPMPDDDLGHVYRSLETQDSRRDEGIVIWDGKDSKQWTFWMQGWFDPQKGAETASFCQVLMPEDCDPDLLYALVSGLAQEVPLLSGHAGYTTQFNAQFKGAAFDQIYAWTKRYLGIEVEDLNLTLPLMRDALKGANWLTVVGNTLWDRLLNHPKRPRHLPDGVKFETLRQGRLFRAGSEPVIGDRNRRASPVPYAAVERLLEPIKLMEHPEFAGRFGEEQATNAWLRRLLAPDAW
jgi:hypothetical protein